MARPEGSIAEAYVANEALTFCSRYFADDDVGTRFNQEGKNRENADLLREGDLSCFLQNVNVIGAAKTSFLHLDYDKLVWHVLNNCDEVEPYIGIYRDQLEAEGVSDQVIDRIIRKEFARWFKSHIEKMPEGEISEDLYVLSDLPYKRGRKYSAYLIGGVRYHTHAREENRKMQNSGIMAAEVFYLPDTLLQDPWRVVQKFEHKHLWSFIENEQDTMPSGMGLAYQDVVIEKTLNDGIGDGSEALMPITDEEEERTVIPAAQVTSICQQVLSNVDGFNSDEEKEDKTIWQYHDEDENPTPYSEED
ncbi:uncharacterized protein [Setaria viridis]|uniref:uncharacterized protein n=1 Tax=Setaria viridis TaxID=4556 RepID=UPI003B3AC22A